MAKAAARYVCQGCGAVSPKWAGRCEACGAWNTLTEEFRTAAPGGMKAGKGRTIAFAPLDGESFVTERIEVGIAEFDHVCGGGLVPASALLIGGDPGIGKSTLLLQVAARLARRGVRVAYVSGEEAVDQVRLRAQRLGLEKSPVSLAAATDVRDIVESIGSADPPAVVIIDSIQTMFVDDLESAPGTVAQVRASAQAFIRHAKNAGCVMILVGHVTKEGQIAGPRVLEHMVDTVLYFEGERGHQFRILRSVKNRFGPSDEIGVFEMTDAGLSEVANPSALFLTERQSPVSGAAVFAGIEGTRPVLVEIQALVAPSALASPRRAVVGWDSGRLSMVVAVLEARCGVSLSGHDVYLNVAGGLRISEPGADLAAAGALVSSLIDSPLPERSVLFGEVGLSGEVRPVSQGDTRLKEAARLGFERAVTPPLKAGRSAPLSVTEVRHLSELVGLMSGSSRAGAVSVAGQDRRHG